MHVLTYEKPQNADIAIRSMQKSIKSIVQTKLVGHAGLGPHDAGWLENELNIEVWKCFDSYDPARVSKKSGRPVSFQTFAYGILLRRAAYILRGRIARHESEPMPSIDADQSVAFQVERLSLLDFQVRGSTAEHAQMQLRLDAESLADELPEPLRTEARLLFLGDVPVSQVPTRAGVSPSAFFHRHLRRIRAHMAPVFGRTVVEA